MAWVAPEVSVPWAEIELSEDMPEQGAGSRVFVATYRGQHVAVRRVAQGNEDQALTEVQITKKLHALSANSQQHPNVLMIHGVTLHRGVVLRVAEVMVLGGINEWAWHTDLHGKANPNSRYDELQVVDVVQLALDAATGLAHMEVNGFAHRDVACQNILCSADLDGEGQLQRGPDGRIVGLRACIADCCELTHCAFACLQLS